MTQLRGRTERSRHCTDSTGRPQLDLVSLERFATLIGSGVPLL